MIASSSGDSDAPLLACDKRPPPTGLSLQLAALCCMEGCCMEGCACVAPAVPPCRSWETERRKNLRVRAAWP